MAQKISFGDGEIKIPQLNIKKIGRLAFLAFINAFCAKVFPSSIGPTLEKIEIGKALTLISFKRIFIY